MNELIEANDANKFFENTVPDYYLERFEKLAKIFNFKSYKEFINYIYHFFNENIKIDKLNVDAISHTIKIFQDDLFKKIKSDKEGYKILPKKDFEDTINYFGEVLAQYLVYLYVKSPNIKNKLSASNLSPKEKKKNLKYILPLFESVKNSLVIKSEPGDKTHKKLLDFYEGKIVEIQNLINELEKEPEPAEDEDNLLITIDEVIIPNLLKGFKLYFSKEDFKLLNPLLKGKTVKRKLIFKANQTQFAEIFFRLTYHKKIKENYRQITKWLCNWFCHKNTKTSDPENLNEATVYDVVRGKKKCKIDHRIHIENLPFLTPEERKKIA